MKPLRIEVIANFFDEIDEKHLTPLDWCPNEHLPGKKTYRIKDLFKVRYLNRICRYREDQEEYCRIDFHNIFRDNMIYIYQAADELNKLKMMADHDHYDSLNTNTRRINTTSTSRDGSDNTTTNKTKGMNKAGSLTGSVDAIQLGSLLKDSLLEVDTDKLPEKVDRNIRQYTQGVTVTNDITDVVVEDRGSSNSNMTTTGDQNTTTRQGIEALNQYRAHSLVVRRLREEFIQCFNTLFY